MSSRFSIFGPLVVSLGVFALTGCSDSKKGFVLKGSVSYQGKPLPSGVVRLHMADGRSAMALIHRDGTFEATDVFPGEAKVTVEDDPAELTKRMPKPRGAAAPPSPGPAKADSAPRVSIPSKYKDVKTSTLSYPLKRDQPLRIELE